MSTDRRRTVEPRPRRSRWSRYVLCDCITAQLIDIYTCREGCRYVRCTRCGEATGFQLNYMTCGHCEHRDAYPTGMRRLAPAPVKRSRGPARRQHRHRHRRALRAARERQRQSREV